MASAILFYCLAEGWRCSLGEKQQLYDHRNDSDGQYPANQLLAM